MDNKVIKNASWIIGCKIAQSVVNLIISMIAVRYLGPSNYGLIAYAASVVAFVLPIMQLGLSKTLVQEFIDHPDREGEVLGTALVMNLLSSLLCIGIVYIFLLVANSGERETMLVGVLFSISLIFQATEMIQYWFQAKLLSKYPSIAMLIAYSAVAIYKIVLLVAGKSVFWFAVSNSIDYVITSIILLVIYHRMGNQKFGFSFSLGKLMFSRSKYYIVSTMMVTIFQQTDRIMIKLMMDEEQVGYYSAAIACVGVTAFVFAAIIDSMRPLILEEKAKGGADYEKQLVSLYSIITYLSLAQCIVMTIFAKPIILILFGKDYIAAVGALRIAVWYITFSYYGSIRNVWILAESKQKYLWIINLSGAVCNVVLNFVLIPIIGIIGAAIASLVTQIFTNVIIGYIIKPIRYNNILMLKGLYPEPIIVFIKNYWNRLFKRR